MLRIAISSVLVSLSLLIPPVAKAILIPPCSVSGGVYTFADNDGEGCAVPADSYSFTLHRAGLCKSFTDFPADSSNSRKSDNPTLFPPQHPAGVLEANNCITVFESSAGASVVINSAGGTSIVGGTITPPPSDSTYTHVFAVVGKELTYATTKTFTQVQNSIGKGSGVKCWTEGPSSFTVSAIPGGTPLPRVRCGDADDPLAGYGAITQVTDCFEPGASGTTLVTDRCFYQLDTLNNVAVWLTDDATLQKVTTTSEVERLVFVQKLSSPVSGEIANLNLGFSTTQAIGLLADPGAADLDEALSFATQGNFLFRVTTK